MTSGRAAKDFFGGMFFLGLGVLLAWQSLGLNVWSPVGPAEGFFPFAIGLLMIAVSLAVMARAILRAPFPGEGSTPERRAGTADRVRVVSYAGLMMLYGVLLAPLGFFAASGLFLISVLKGAEGKSWKMTIGTGTAALGISYVLFVRLLGVPLPRGLLW